MRWELNEARLNDLEARPILASTDSVLCSYVVLIADNASFKY